MLLLTFIKTKNNSFNNFSNFSLKFQLKREWAVAKSETSCRPLYQTALQDNFTLIDGGESFKDKDNRKVEAKFIEPGLHPTMVVIVRAANNETRERLAAQALKDNRTYVSAYKIIYKLAVLIPEDQSVFLIQ